MVEANMSTVETERLMTNNSFHTLSFSQLTNSSLARGDRLQMMSFTLTHTGNATPFSTIFPSDFFFV
jgi:hypothetical protein